MQWIAPYEKDLATDTLEKRLWPAADYVLATPLFKDSVWFRNDDVRWHGAAAVRSNQRVPRRASPCHGVNSTSGLA